MKNFKEMGISDHFTCLLRNLYAGQQLEVDMEQQTDSKLGKEYIKAVCCHPASLTYAEYIMRSTRLDESKLESRLPGEISITSDMQITPPLWQEAKN